jgi:hypothetical protein
VEVTTGDILYAIGQTRRTLTSAAQARPLQGTAEDVGRTAYLPVRMPVVQLVAGWPASVPAVVRMDQNPDPAVAAHLRAAATATRKNPGTAGARPPAAKGHP